MKPEQCDRLFQLLLDHLEKIDLDWVRDEVNGRIAQGKPIKKSILAGPELRSPVESRRRRKRVTFVGTEPFTPAERVGILVQAIRHAVVATADMELQIIHNLGSKDESVGVHFYSEDGDRPLVTIDADTVMKKRGAVENLRRLLDRAEKRA
jgi:hypothetical protein